MNTLRLVFIILSLSLFASCGKQSSINLVDTGSLVRAGNGGLYSTGCLRASASPSDIAKCQISEGDDKVASSNRGARGIADQYYNYGGGTNGYSNPLSFPYGGQNGQYYNWNYNQSWAWNPNQFTQNSWQNFFQYGGQQVWGDPNGWLQFIYGYGYGQGNDFHYGGGNSLCNIGWLQGQSFQPSQYGQDYLLCGNQWDPNNGYGYSPGWGGYYPQTNDRVVELTQNRSGNQATEHFYISGTPVNNSPRSYQVIQDYCPGVGYGAPCSSGVYKTISAGRMDHILTLISRIHSTTLQPVHTTLGNCVQGQSQDHRVIQAKNGSLPISDRNLGCGGSSSENSDPAARQLEDYFLRTLGFR